MTKSKNKRKERRLKNHLHISIPAELYEKVKNAGLNASQIAEEALKRVIYGTDTENIRKTLILRLESEKEWTRPDSNRRPPPCQGDVIARPDLENNPNPDDSEISTPLRKTTNPVDTSNGNYARQGNKMGSDSPILMSLAELQEKHSAGYERYCLEGDKKIEAGTYRDYKNAIATYGQSIFTPADILEFYTNNEIPLPEKVAKGAARLFRFLKGRLSEKDRNLNNFSFGDYIDAFNEAKSAAGSEEDNIAHNVSPAELKKWVAEVPEKYGDFFLLLAYTGARIDQLHSILSELPPAEREARSQVLMPGGDTPVQSPVFRMDVADLGAEKKRVNMYYVPYECRDLLLNYTPAFKTPDTFSKAAKPAGVNAARKDGKTVSGKTLRKWNTNLFISAGVPAEIAGWIEGRVPTKHNSAAAVTWNNYADLDDLAAVAYGNMQEAILKLLPRDTKFGTSISAPSTPPVQTPNSSSGRVQITEEKKAAIIEMLKKDVSIREIAKTLGAGRTTVKRIKEELEAEKKKQKKGNK